MYGWGVGSGSAAAGKRGEGCAASDAGWAGMLTGGPASPRDVGPALRTLPSPGSRGCPARREVPK